MISPLVLGNKSFNVNIVQGPLAGVSCAPFRLLAWRYGRPGFSCTEMISCKTLIHRPQFSLKRFILKDKNEGPVCFQLASDDPLELGEATKIVTDAGADLVDLNCGCPVKKIRSKGAGSRLLKDPSTLYKLILAMKQNTHLPVSVKIRIPDILDEKNNLEIAKVVNEAGADFLVVHGRHWTEHYETPCRYDLIKFFVSQVKIPVIGNGDIANLESLKKMHETGCKGFMIGRAGVGQPWLTQELIAAYKNEEFSKPSQKEITEIFLEHVSGLIDLIGNEKFAILQSRKFSKYYARHLPNPSITIPALHQCTTFSALQKIIT